MGQQQLILLVLATVIVGIAIVVGITAFSENSARANADALMQDAVRIGNDIQAWGQKPLQFGGPDPATEDFTNVTFGDMGYEDDGAGTYTNMNGDFTLAPTAGQVLITGQRLVEGGTDPLNQVQVLVCGTQSEDDIVGAVRIIREVAVGDAPTCAGGTTTTGT